MNESEFYDGIIEKFEYNYEFNKTINELIEYEVEKRIKESNEDYEYKLNQYEKAIEESNKLRKEVSKLKRDLEEADSFYSQKGYAEAKKELLNNFELGEKVWYIAFEHYRDTCPTCQGEKEVPILTSSEKRVIRCPECNGTGTKSKTKSYPKQARITELHISHWAEGRRTETKAYVDASHFECTKVSNLFKSKEEAENYIQECDNK